MRSRKRQLCVACAHAGGRATVGRGEGAGERAATGEAGAERAEVEAKGPWGGAGRALSPWFVEAVLACAQTQHENNLVSSQMSQGVCLCGLPRRYGSRGQWGLWKGQPEPTQLSRTTALSTSFDCIHRSLLLCTPRRSHTELSLPTSLPLCSVGSWDPRRRRRLAWVPPPVLWPAPLLCA
jgi:hypothetical protein